MNDNRWLILTQYGKSPIESGVCVCVCVCDCIELHDIDSYCTIVQTIPYMNTITHDCVNNIDFDLN